MTPNEAIAKLNDALIAIGCEACAVPDVDETTLANMVAEGLIEDADGNWELTNKGTELFRGLMAEKPLFDE